MGASPGISVSKVVTTWTKTTIRRCQALGSHIQFPSAFANPEPNVVVVEPGVGESGMLVMGGRTVKK